MLPEEHPRNLTEESPAEENAATFQACVRVEQRQAEWAGFAEGYRVLAGRIPGPFELDGWKGAQGRPGRKGEEGDPSQEAGASWA